MPKEEAIKVEGDRLTRRMVREDPAASPDDADVQAAVLEAAKKAEARGWEMSKKETAAKIAILKENGMNIVTPSDELMKGLQDVANTMLVDWKKDAGKEGEALLNAYK